MHTKYNNKVDSPNSRHFGAYTKASVLYWDVMVKPHPTQSNSVANMVILIIIESVGNLWWLRRVIYNANFEPFQT